LGGRWDEHFFLSFLLIFPAFIFGTGDWVMGGKGDGDDAVML
jgi:hypothetical protein